MQVAEHDRLHVLRLDPAFLEGLLYALWHGVRHELLHHALHDRRERRRIAPETEVEHEMLARRDVPQREREGGRDDHFVRGGAGDEELHGEMHDARLEGGDLDVRLQRSCAS
ncbi:hypothetical protein NUW54_g4334 [Trametes sanguinea]|uniref:Uncharacterized protein n=1 Tax=Trametes sanguinea TaxID=158606 RepID=A0ACC1Q1S7_9APHY|nr:hypothetical protein NUW54_g4334 [Trametes sanguinea]